jgi:hypothetical protein
MGKAHGLLGVFSLNPPKVFVNPSPNSRKRILVDKRGWAKGFG